MGWGPKIKNRPKRVALELDLGEPLAQFKVVQKGHQPPLIVERRGGGTFKRTASSLCMMNVAQKGPEVGRPHGRIAPLHVVFGQ
jgi:hypothetical protein